MLREAVASYALTTGEDPGAVDPDTPRGRLLRAQMDAIVAMMDESQSTTDREGTGLEGFVPAVFARLVNERFRAEVGDLATVKVTAPRHLVRNRRSRPDDWETGVIEGRLMSGDWPAGDVFEERTAAVGRDAFRVLVPEYHGEGCHGGPAGEIDVTGYPKEDGAPHDLGGVIAITLSGAH